MMIAFCVFAVLCLINISMVSCQPGLSSPQPCSDFVLVPMDNFHKEFYDGDWFMHQLYDVPRSRPYDCYVVLSTPYPNGSLNVTEILLKPDVLPEIRNEGVSTFSTDGKGVITYASTGIPSFNGEYKVLKTDYATYTIEVSCINVSSGSVLQLNIMSRTPAVTATTQSQIDAVIAASGLNATAIRTLNIQSCPSELIEGAGLFEKLLKLLLGLVGGLLGGLFG